MLKRKHKTLYYSVFITVLIVWLKTQVESILMSFEEFNSSKENFSWISYPLWELKIKWARRALTKVNTRPLPNFSTQIPIPKCSELTIGIKISMGITCGWIVWTLKLKDPLIVIKGPYGDHGIAIILWRLGLTLKTLR